MNRFDRLFGLRGEARVRFGDGEAHCFVGHNVLTTIHRQYGHWCMGVVGCDEDNAVDVWVGKGVFVAFEELNPWVFL